MALNAEVLTSYKQIDEVLYRCNMIKVKKLKKIIKRLLF